MHHPGAPHRLAWLFDRDGLSLRLARLAELAGFERAVSGIAVVWICPLEQALAFDAQHGIGAARTIALLAPGQGDLPVLLVERGRCVGVEVVPAARVRAPTEKRRAMRLLQRRAAAEKRMGRGRGAAA